MPPPVTNEELLAKLEEIRKLLAAIHCHVRCIEFAAREVKDMEVLPPDVHGD